MAGVPRPLARTPSRTSRGNRGGIPSDELRARRRGGDYSHLGLVLESIRPPSLFPDCNEDLPCIPSTSTGLWGDDAVSISTEIMGSPTASPIVGCPALPVPSHQVCERAPIIEAQHVAVLYRQRRRSVSGNPPALRYPFPLSTVTQSGVSAEAQAMNASLRASLMLPQSPQIRRPIAEETETPTSHDGAGPLSRVREDGTAACDREDCLAILPDLQAFLCHLHIHLIHEGYVIHLGRWIGVLSVFCPTD